jgi:uncharacterized membrane protein YoaK (UPF0700 family)
MAERHPAPRILIALSLATGVTDAFAFLALNGVFSANMTGNLILIALYERAHYPAVLAGTGTAVVVFAAALFFGFRISRQAASRAGLRPLVGALVFQAMTVVVWEMTQPAPSTGARLLLIGLSCAAMALQTVAARRMGADRSVSTTFATGTLTGLMQDMADGVPGERVVRCAAIAALSAGAALGAFLMHTAPLLAPTLSTGLVTLALVLSLDAQRVGSDGAVR